MVYILGHAAHRSVCPFVHPSVSLPVGVSIYLSNKHSSMNRVEFPYGNLRQFESKLSNFQSRKCISKYRLQNGNHFVSASIFYHIEALTKWQTPLQWRHNGRWRLKLPALRLFTQPFIQAQIKENIKAPRHWPLCGEFTGDRAIPRTNGQ